MTNTTTETKNTSTSFLKIDDNFVAKADNIRDFHLNGRNITVHFMDGKTMTIPFKDPIEANMAMKNISIIK